MVSMRRWHFRAISLILLLGAMHAVAQNLPHPVSAAASSSNQNGPTVGSAHQLAQKILPRRSNLARFKSPIMRKLWENSSRSSHDAIGIANLNSPIDLGVSLFVTTPPMYTGGANEKDVALGDFNADGKQDIIVAANPPVLLLGNGDGTFQPPVQVGAGGLSVTGVAVADFNRDGAVDVAFATSGSVIVCLGNGNGTFATAVNFSTGGSNQNVVPRVLAADVNNDGLVDLILDTDNGISVLLGNGNGAFQPARSSPASAQYMAVADFNNDGRLDVAVTDGYGTLSILLGQGNGTFSAGNTYPLSSFHNFNSIAIADFNQDRNLDLAMPNGQIFLGNGDGSFRLTRNFETGPQATIVEAVDLNGDGIADLVTVSSGGDCGFADLGNTGVALGNGDGTFEPVRVFDSGGCFYPIFAAYADLNGDGAEDLVMLAGGNGIGGNEVSVLINRGNGTFPTAELNISGGSGSVAVDDFNRDGNSDLVLGDGSVYLGKGDGSLRFLASAFLSAVDVVTGDFNGDGKPDLASAVECVPTDCSIGGQLLISFGNGDGTFQSPTSLPSGGFYAESLAIGDFNRDGALDVAILNNCADSSCSAGGSISIFLGNGNGTFHLSGTISLPLLPFNGFPVAVAAGDFNNDGILDLAVAGSISGARGPGTASILLGKGNGTFVVSDSFEVQTGDGIVAIATGDFNQDGILDLALAAGAACADCQAHGTVIYGNGDGTFVAGPYLGTSGGPPVSVVAADFYGNGSPTEVFANHCGDTLDCPSGSVFVEGPSGQTNIMLLFLAVGDFNNDGKPDLAGSLEYEPGASVLLNVGAAAEATTMTLSPSAKQTYPASQSATFTAQIHHTGPGTPTSTVNFLDNGVSIGSAVVDGNGQASIATSALKVGSHFIVPYYSGDNDFAASNSLGVRITVAQATTATVVSSSANPSYPNQAVTFTANVTSQFRGTLSGSVVFKQGKTIVATVSLSDGQAAFTTTYPTTGVRQITANYSGESNDLGSTSTVLKQSVNKLPAVTTTKVTTSGSASYVGQAVTFTATTTSTLGPIPDGEIVTFYNGATVMGTGVTATGRATLSTSSLTAKTHVIKAIYSGDGTFKTSFGTAQQIVNLYSSTTTLTSNPNPSTKGHTVTLTATVQSSNPNNPTGTIIFKSGTQSLGSAKLSGDVATLNTARLPVGTDSITAVYGGDAETSKSISGTVNQTIE